MKATILSRKDWYHFLKFIAESKKANEPCVGYIPRYAASPCTTIYYIPTGPDTDETKKSLLKQNKTSGASRSVIVYSYELRAFAGKRWVTMMADEGEPFAEFKELHSALWMAYTMVCADVKIKNEERFKLKPMAGK